MRLASGSREEKKRGFLLPILVLLKPEMLIPTTTTTLPLFKSHCMPLQTRQGSPLIGQSVPRRPRVDLRRSRARRSSNRVCDFAVAATSMQSRESSKHSKEDKKKKNELLR